MKLKDFLNHNRTENDIKNDIYNYGKSLDTIDKPANSFMELYLIKHYESGNRAVSLGKYDIYFQNISELNMGSKPLVKLVSDGSEYILYFQVIKQAILMDSKQNVKKVFVPSFTDFIGENDELSNLFQSALDKVRYNC